jgi:NitT/TauT family transport system substrate-binding protein
VGKLAISLADTGEVDIASMASSTNFTVAINEGANVVAFATTYKYSPSGIAIVAETPEGETFEKWDSMADIRGRKVGFPAGALVAWTVMMEYHGVAPDEYEEVQTGFDLTPLIDGSVDAIWAFETNFGADMMIGDYRIHHLRSADNGYLAAGDFIFTNRDYLEENPDIVCRFIKAQDEATRWGWDHLDEIAEHIVAKHGEEFEMDINEELLQLTTAAKLTQDWEHENGLHYIDAETWQLSLDLLEEYELIDVKPDVYDVITTEINECVYGVP